MSSWNPLTFLGLRKNKGNSEAADEDPKSEDTPTSSPSGPRTSLGGLELNRRGVPARKRKLNSLIYGTDELVSIPIKSPKKRGPKGATPNKEKPSKAETKSAPSSPKKAASATPKSPTKARSPIKSPTKSSPTKANRDPVVVPFANRESPVKSTPSSPVKKKAKTPVSKKKLLKKRRNSSPTKKKSAALLAKEFMKGEPFDPELTSPEKKSAQRLGVALRNLLKLPKGHRWVCYEFFYSNLDRILFEGENDFMVCLKESFPQLKTRRLSRVEWCKVRRLMGKPRRCSSAFFAEERAELARKRQKIRMLQQRKQSDFSSFKDLPDHIPLLLTIGARVTARLRKPQDGLFMGTVDAYDTSNNTYRIRFDRDGLGTRSVPDEDVVSADGLETLPLSTFTVPKVRPPRPILPSPTKLSPMKSVFVNNSFSPQVPANDPLLSGNTPRGKILHVDGHVGGYPIKFLEQIVRLSKSLKKKRELIGTLRNLNATGERRKSFGDVINEDFQRRYASTVLDLSHLNRDLNEHLKNIQEFTEEFAPEAGPTISLPNIIRESCQEDAYDMVNKNNNANTEDRGECVENPRVLELVSSMTSLMCIMHRLADGERNAYEVQALQDSLAEIKKGLSKENLNKFENNVEVHMHHIQSGLSQMGNLRVFVMNAAGPQNPMALNAAPGTGSKSFIKVVPTVRTKIERSDSTSSSN